MTARTDEWLTVAEACDYLKVTRATLYRWARQGRLRLHKIGSRTTRISLAELLRLSEPSEDVAWAGLSEQAFARDWDNDKDAAYDNWREIYGVPQG